MRELVRDRDRDNVEGCTRSSGLESRITRSRGERSLEEVVSLTEPSKRSCRGRKEGEHLLKEKNASVSFRFDGGLTKNVEERTKKLEKSKEAVRGDFGSSASSKRKEGKGAISSSDSNPQQVVLPFLPSPSLPSAPTPPQDRPFHPLGRTISLQDVEQSYDLQAFGGSAREAEESRGGQAVSTLRS